MGNRQNRLGRQNSNSDIEMGGDAERCMNRRRQLEIAQEMRRIESKARNQANIEARRAAYAKSASEPVSCFYSVFCSCWTMGYRFSWVVQDIIDGIDASEAEKLQLWEYYVKMVEDYEAQARRAGWWLVHLQTLRTTFNIVLPAILALQNLGSLSTIIMWLTWGLSLAVSLATGYIDLFKLQHRFEMLTRASEYMKLEGWQFFGLIGRYGRYTSHHDALNLFLFRIAKIRKRIIDMEFPPSARNHEAAETNQGNPATSPAAGIQPLSGVKPRGFVPAHGVKGFTNQLFVGPSFSEDEDELFQSSNSPFFPGKYNTRRRSAPPTRGFPHEQSPPPTPTRPTPTRPTPIRPIPTTLPSIRVTPRSLAVASRDTEDEESDDETVRM